jgi:SSS family solute:Na+ symporter
MKLFGFHPVDVALIVGYLALITYFGKRASRKIKNQEDFFLAGRGVGKLFQFFLNMSTITDAGQAVNTAAAAFAKGLGGVWILLAPLFSGPYYWFMSGWFRRVRLVTMAELFDERFRSRTLAFIYACVGIWLSVINIGIANKISLRTFQAMTLKPEAEYSAEEQQQVTMFAEYRQLDSQYKAGELPPEQTGRHDTLSNMFKKGQIAPWISYTKAHWFYAVYIIFVGAYVIMGGLKAAVLNNFLQGMLILVFSIMMIPIGLYHLGGWSGFSAKLPDHMLSLFGSGLNEFSLASIIAYLLANYIVGITGHQGNMSNYGSAKDEITARTGCIGGTYTKRVLTVMWAMSGLLAYALYHESISDPDTAWGVMSNNLLGIGLRGIMISGILAANMSTLAGVSVYLSALFVRNLYKPFVKNRSEHHYITASRVSIGGILLLSILVAVKSAGIINILKMLPSLNVIFGAPVLLLLFWKRLTLKAVYAQVIFCVLTFGILPGTLPLLKAVRQSQWLTAQTQERTIVREVSATQEDVDAGRAVDVGQKISKELVVPPAAIYFDKVARSDLDDPNSPMAGIGRVNPELVIAKIVGMNLKSKTPSQLLTIRYLIDAILPFLIMIPISLITTNRGLEENIKRFYVKLKTQVIADRELDDAELEKSYANPSRFDHQKLFPKSNWEFCKWTKEDLYGFLATSALTAIILAGFWMIVKTLQ